MEVLIAADRDGDKYKQEVTLILWIRAESIVSVFALADISGSRLESLPCLVAISSSATSRFNGSRLDLACMLCSRVLYISAHQASSVFSCCHECQNSGIINANRSGLFAMW